MKIGGLLMAFLVTLLSIVPCCTFEECEDEKREILVQHEKPSECEDSCSPFLNCGSCTGFPVQETSEPGEIAFNLPIDKIDFHHRQTLPQSLIQSIWQPPRLG